MDPSKAARAALMARWGEAVQRSKAWALPVN